MAVEVGIRREAGSSNSGNSTKMDIGAIELDNHENATSDKNTSDNYRRQDYIDQEWQDGGEKLLAAIGKGSKGKGKGKAGYSDFLKSASTINHIGLQEKEVEGPMRDNLD